MKKKKGLTVRSLLNTESFEVPANTKRVYYTPVQKKNFLEPIPIRKDVKKRMNKRLKMNGLKMLKKLGKESIRVAFFDPSIHYQVNPMEITNPMKSMYNHPLNAGNVMYEPINDGSTMDAQRKSILAQFIRAYYRVIVPSGFLFMWIDEMPLFHGIDTFLWRTEFIRRNFITWDVGEVKVKLTDYKKSTETFKEMSNLMILQKPPNKTEGYWFDGWFLDIYKSKTKVESKWKKPIDLQARLIKASTLESDLVVDAAAGSFSVFKACQKTGRNFLGCDIQ